jgi:uncharacterized protein (DUF433 family)
MTECLSPQKPLRYHALTMSKISPEAAPADKLLPVIAEFIAIEPGFCGGKPHVLGHRIKVQHIAVWHDRIGMTPEEIVATYPSLTLPAVFAALAYYHSHRTEIDHDIETDEKFIADLRAKAGPSDLHKKLDALHGKEDPVSS